MISCIERLLKSYKIFASYNNDESLKIFLQKSKTIKISLFLN